MKSAAGPRDAVNARGSRVNAHSGGKLGQGDSRCRVCLGPLPSGVRHNSDLPCCGPRCRLRLWALRELVRALSEGQVEGLREELEERFAREKR